MFVSLCVPKDLDNHCTIKFLLTMKALGRSLTVLGRMPEKNNTPPPIILFTCSFKIIM